MYEILFIIGLILILSERYSYEFEGNLKSYQIWKDSDNKQSRPSY